MTGEKKPVPVNAAYLYPRRTCAIMDTKMNCTLTGKYCNYSEPNEHTCPNHVTKKPRDVKVLLIDNWTGYIVIENGISTHHTNKPFDCAECQVLLPGKAEEKCWTFCPFPHDPATFKCVGYCHFDGKYLTISVQHQAGYLFCLHACPITKSKKYDQVTVAPREKKPRKRAAAPATTPSVPARTPPAASGVGGDHSQTDGLGQVTGDGNVAAAKKPRKEKPAPPKDKKQQTRFF